MTILIILLFGFVFISLGKLIFHKYFNPLSLYSFVWMFILSVYETKLISYDDLSITTWSVIIFAQIAITLGVLTVFSARKALKLDNNIFEIKENITFSLFLDDGKILKKIIILFSIIGILAALQHWYILINEFGSFVKVLINSAKIYRMRVEGDIKGVVPYIFLFTFFAIFLSGLYSGYKNQFKLFMIIPFIGLIIKSLAEVARASMLFGIIMFFISYLLMRHLKTKQVNDNTSKNNKKIVLGLVILLLLIIISASVVKTFRSPAEDYKASSRSLRQFEEGFIISPAIYLYASAHVGVLNAYMYSQNENTSFGENMFLPVYRFLSKFNFVEKPSFYQKGYFIPMWTNTGTYLRELHADYGPTGLFLFPYLLGLISTFLWFKYFETYELKYYVLLTFIMILITFTFLVMITRLGYWFISLFGILILIPVLERIVVFFVERNGVSKKNPQKKLDYSIHD